jgi:hypothetical protein
MLIKICTYKKNPNIKSRNIIQEVDIFQKTTGLVY